jgi:hypothetical protein
MDGEIGDKALKLAPIQFLKEIQAVIYFGLTQKNSKENVGIN